MKISRTVVATMSLLALGGCVTGAKYQRSLSRWTGATEQALRQDWGYPSERLKMPDGRIVYVYAQRSGYTAPLTAPSVATITGMGKFTGYSTTDAGNAGGHYLPTHCTTYFEISRDKRVVGARFAGNGCSVQ